jgi:tetratricopeptide (TPR) repeat protein
LEFIPNLQRARLFVYAYDAALKINPNSSLAWSSKGYVLHSIKRYNEAIECYDAALKINPKDHNAMNSKAYGLSYMNRNKEALALINKALEYEPNDHKYLDTKGFILFNLRKYSEAIKWFDKSLAIDSNYEESLMHKQSMLVRKGKKHGKKHVIHKSLLDNKKSIIIGNMTVMKISFLPYKITGFFIVSAEYAFYLQKTRFIEVIVFQRVGIRYKISHCMLLSLLHVIQFFFLCDTRLTHFIDIIILCLLYFTSFFHMLNH